MIFFRVIPLLLLENESCIKTIKFKKKIYLGDPINIVKSGQRVARRFDIGRF